MVHPDIVICDIGLPGINGYAGCRAAQAARRSDLPPALTDWDQPPDRERSLVVGFDLHLVKLAGAQMLGAVMLAVSRPGDESVGAAAIAM